MSLESDVSLLGRVPLLAEFGAERLRLLAFSAESLRLEDGQVLFEAGDTADSAYVIVSGEIALYSPFRANHLLEVCGSGRMIDERSLIVTGERLSRAVARGDCEIIRIRRNLFRRMLEEYPDTAARLRPHFAAKLVELSEALDPVRRRLDDLDD
ncbi:putative signal-transduction protein containing cAMP-binding and CBS domains [Hartmannibacter diazotrophicus]|uniref:Putative signal-transduction protein containing cAMP-binding and CBS domains n=1 Tax=Hartmannibacter diazotrophicus TaxID=1482074 RepID=A0A2C9DCY8_9HYPH|nr:Crp/Fnr family transcriptional regulator [Hartmannibacter diazotrophicus]SON58167.1 putative signal-transduction protein containing cAMP-binding and CBS domains [Hartmannibacter diazotrophicus]